MYLFYLSPIIDKRNYTISNVAQEEQVVQQLAERKRKLEEEREQQQGQTTELQYKLPVVPLTDQFLLDINRAEELANVRIVELVMNDDLPVYQAPETASLNIIEEDNSVEETSDEGVSDSEVIDADLYKQQANIVVKVNTYDSLSRFIEELDSLIRITNVEELYFTREDRTEDIIIDGEDALFYQLVVSSYYFPAIEHLEHEAPKVEYPTMEERDQPFSD